MLSWSDEADVFSKRPSMNKAGSLQRPGNSFEAQRSPSSRKSVEVPAAPGGSSSPAGSLGKAPSLLRGPGHAAEGTIGSEGWWHASDHSQMNEPPLDGKGEKKAAGFVPQTGITGQSKSLWADETPAAAAPVAAAPQTSAFAEAANVAPAPEPPATDASLAQPAAAAEPAARPAAPAAAAAPGSSPGADSETNIQNAGTTGWWKMMDAGQLNQAAEKAPLAAGEVRKGERVMGGGFTPQFSIGGGNRYGSIFDQETKDQAAPADTKPLEQQVAGWGPFQGKDEQQARSAAAPGDEGWSNFTSAQ